ncbi:unnamed protein product [Closterium sp. Yama58-4]|nr:unnamed protein product [Closterium sp. Yama58-4]
MGVNAGGGQVGSSAGGTSSRLRGVIHADEVGGVQARGMRSTAAAGTSQGDVGGRRSGLMPMAASQVTAGGIAPSYGYYKFTPDRISVTPPLVGRPDILTWKEAIEPQLEMAGLISFARGTVETPDDPDLRAEFRAVQLLTFTVISRCCTPGVQIALKWCREYLDAGHQAWHFIESTYQVTDDLFIAQLEGQLTHLRMGDEETATDYCNRARRILATIRMAGAEYSTASYITHVMQGLPSSYNLLKRLSMAPSTRATLNEDTLTSYILQDEAMQEAERSQELLAQVNYVAPVKQGGRPGQRGQSGGGGSSGWKSAKEVDKKKSTKDSGRPWEIWQSSSTSWRKGEAAQGEAVDHVDHGEGRRLLCGGKARDDKTASCSLVGVVEPTVSLAPEAGEDFQAVAAAVQANPAVVLLDSGCSHHLMGTKDAFVDLEPSGDVKHVRGFNGALQDVQGRGTVALQGEAGKQVLIPDVLYVPGVHANLLSSGQLKEHGVKLKEDGDGMLLVSATGEVLGRATYSGRILCTDLRPCSTRPTSTTPEVVALRAIVSKAKSTPDRMHARLAHVGMDTIRSSAKNEVAIGLDLKSATGADSPCVSCVSGKLARHTFPDQGSDAADLLAVVHIDLCGPFRVAAKDGSLYFLLLKDRKTRFVWVRPVAKKSDVLLEFQKWLVLVERRTKKSMLMLRSDRGGEFLGKQFTDFVDGKGIVHDLTCPYTPQQNGMAEREMRTVVESVRTMLLHMGMQHHWWHLALRQAVWIRNCLERSATPGTTLYQLLTGTKPDLSLARVWGCMAQFLVPEQQRGGKLKPKAKWGLHLGVSEASKGWELLDIAANRVVTTSDVVFYEDMSLEEWKSAHGPVSGRTLMATPTDTSTATLPLLAEVGEPAEDDAEVVHPSSPSPAPPLVADLRGLTPPSASGDEGSSGTSPVAPTKGIAGGRRDEQQVDEQQVDMGVQPTWIGEEQVEEVQPAARSTKEQSATWQSVGELTAGEKSVGTPTEVQQDDEDGSEDEGEQLGDEELVDQEVVDQSTDRDVAGVPPEPRMSGRLRRPPDFFVPAAFTTVYDVEDDDDLLYDDADEDEEFPELDPDMLADPEHRWDISTMSVKEALASWKGPAVKAAMEEEIRSLIAMGTWELVERPDDKTASCSLVGVVEPTVSLAPEAGEDFQAVAAAVQANPAVVLLDSGCSHHLMGTKDAFVDLEPSGDVKHVRGFNGALQDVQGRGTVALQGEAGKQVLIPDVLYVPGVHANLLSSGQLKEHGVKLKEDGDGMLLVSATGEVLGRATYSGRILCTDLRPCSTRPTSTTPEVVALRAIVSKAKSTPDRMHARLAHVGMDTIRSSAKNEVAIGLDLKSATGADSPCVSCVSGKLARHTFPDQGSDAADLLAVVHIDLCGPFRVAAKDGSLYFLLLKDRKTRFVWVRPVAKKSDVLLEFQKWLVLVERQTKKSVLMLRSDRGGEFLGKQFTDFVDGKGIVHDLTCPYTPQQNGMAEREMRTVVESVRTMLLHMGMQHHWWHLALRQAVWIRNCLERSATPGTTPYQLLTGTKPDLSLARVWGCMAQFLVPEQQRGGKLKPKAKWGLHLGVSEASKGWELLDIAANRVVTTSDVVFYEDMSLEEWKSAHGPVSGRTLMATPTDTSTATLPLLAEVGEPAEDDAEVVHPSSPSPAPPLVADLRGLTPPSASGDEGSSGTSPVAPTKGIAGGQRDEQQVDEQQVDMGVQSTDMDRGGAGRGGAASSAVDQGAVGDLAVGRGADRRGEVGRDADRSAAGRRGRQ